MRDMKDSEAKWVGKKPTNWELGKIKYYARIKTGSTPSTDIPEWFDGDINWFTPGDFSDAFILKKSSRTLSSKAVSDNIVFPFPKGIVMIVGIGATAGKVGFTIEEGYCNQQITALIPYKINPKFLMYWLVSNTDILCGTALYTTLPIINNQMLDNHMCLCPIDICLQKRIVVFLDKKCSEIDALAADIKKQIETLEEYKRSVITEAVTKGLDPDVEMKDSQVEWVGAIPAEWEMRKARYMFVQRFDKGNSLELQLLSPTQSYGVIPQWKYEELSGMVAVKLNEKADLMQLKTIHKGDYCISLRSFQGGFEYSKYEGVVSPAYQVFYPTVQIDDRYYKYMFKDRGFIEKMNSYTLTLRDGKNISFFDFGNTYIPYPPVEIQQTVADYLDRKCNEIENIIADKNKQLATLTEYKKSLIYEYVTGKKEV